MIETSNTVIADKYELIDIVGEGGMATVWRATMHGAAGFTRPVAVKKIKPEYRAIKNYIAMFVEEARVGSELAHPNIVQVIDFCVDASNSYYLIMEWVEGLDLGSFVRFFSISQQVSPWALVCAIGIGSLRGLSAAHERRHADGSGAPVIHRDISPHNILLGVNGIAKLTDFGLARARDRIFSLTAPGTVKGKLSYLAPESTRGDTASPATDIFAMGTVLWEALAGRRLFDATTDLEVFRQIRDCDVRPLAELRPDAPPALIDIVHTALDKDPARRHKSAKQMATSLADVLAQTRSNIDAQTLLGTRVTQAREHLRANKLSDAELDQPTWTHIDVARLDR